MKLMASKAIIVAICAASNASVAATIGGGGIRRNLSGVSEGCNSETQDLISSNQELASLFESLEQQVDEGVTCVTTGLINECEVDFKGLESSNELIDACSNAGGDIITTAATMDCFVASGARFIYYYTNIMDCVAPVCVSSDIDDEINTVMVATEELIEAETSASCTFTVSPLTREVSQEEGGEGENKGGDEEDTFEGIGDKEEGEDDGGKSGSSAVTVSLGFMNTVILPAIALSHAAAIL